MQELRRASRELRGVPGAVAEVVQRREAFVVLLLGRMPTLQQERDRGLLGLMGLIPSQARKVQWTTAPGPFRECLARHRARIRSHLC